MIINTYSDCVKEAGISDNLLEKVSSQHNNKRARWANGQIGAIVDMKGDGTLCFVELAENSNTEDTSVDAKDVKSYPFVACGFVAYLLTRFGDDTSDIFCDYYDICCRRFQSDRKSPDAWKNVSNEGRKILNEKDIEDELALMWQSRTLLPYITEDDHKTLQSFCKNYIEFMQQKYDQICGRKDDTPSDMLFDFQQMYEGRNSAAMKCIEWLEDEKDGICPPAAPDWSLIGIVDTEIVPVNKHTTHFSDCREEGEFRHNVLIPHQIIKSAELYHTLDFEKIRVEIVSNLEKCTEELTCKNYVKSLLEPLREFANRLHPEYVIKGMKKDMAEGWMTDLQKQVYQQGIEKMKDVSHWLNLTCGMNAVMSEIKQQSSVKAAMEQSLSDFKTGLLKLTLLLSPLLLVRRNTLKDWLAEWEFPSVDLDIATLNVDGKTIYTPEHAQKLIDNIRMPKTDKDDSKHMEQLAYKKIIVKSGYYDLLLQTIQCLHDAGAFVYEDGSPVTNRLDSINTLGDMLGHKYKRPYAELNKIYSKNDYLSGIKTLEEQAEKYYKGRQKKEKNC